MGYWCGRDVCVAQAGNLNFSLRGTAPGPTPAAAATLTRLHLDLHLAREQLEEDRALASSRSTGSQRSGAAAWQAEALKTDALATRLARVMTALDTSPVATGLGVKPRRQ